MSILVPWLMWSICMNDSSVRVFQSLISVKLPASQYIHSQAAVWGLCEAIQWWGGLCEAIKYNS